MIEMVNLGLSNPFIGRHCRPAPSLYSNPLSCTSCQRSDYTVLSIVVVYLIRSSPLIAIRQRQSTGPHQKPTSGAIGYLTVHTVSFIPVCGGGVSSLGRNLKELLVRKGRKKVLSFIQHIHLESTILRIIFFSIRIMVALLLILYLSLSPTRTHIQCIYSSFWSNTNNNCQIDGGVRNWHP